MIQTIAFVPARSGSKRLKDKNRLQIGGISLIRRTLMLLGDVGFNKIVLSTNNKEYFCEAEGLDVCLELRNADLSNDFATTSEVLLAWLNRSRISDDTIIFNSLNREAIHKIIYMELDKLKERVLDAVKIKVKINKSAVEYVATQGYDKAYGARPLNRSIQKFIEDPMTDDILSNKFKEGDTIKISYDKKTDKIILS